MRPIVKKIITSILYIESRLVLYKYKPKIIAITGSIGKTSTKDAVYAVLSRMSYVRKSEKSYNSEIGLPLTVLGLPNAWNNPMAWCRNFARGLWLFLAPHKYPKWLVLEVGIGKPGDMKRTALNLLRKKADAVIITAIGETPAHIEFFNSRKHLIEEKSQLIDTLKRGGLLILNGDDPDVLAMKAKTKERFVTYGFNPGADIVGSGESVLYNDSGVPSGVMFRIDEGGNSFPVTIEGVFGRNHMYASLGALALAISLKFPMLTALDALKVYDVPPGRMRLLAGIKNTLIIDDSYNSSPAACISALRTLGTITQKNVQDNRKHRKIAVLGDMLELGKHTSVAHKNVGKVAAETADVLVTVGHRAEGIKDGAIEAGMFADNIFQFLDSYEARDFVKDFIAENDIILIKGSQGMRMERVIEPILLDQEHMEDLLVRQDKEWKNKK